MLHVIPILKIRVIVLKVLHMRVNYVELIALIKDKRRSQWSNGMLDGGQNILYVFVFI